MASRTVASDALFAEPPKAADASAPRQIVYSLLEAREHKTDKLQLRQQDQSRDEIPIDLVLAELP